MVKFLCSNPECRKKLEVADELAGKKVRCPKCRTVMVVPDVSGGTEGGSSGYEATLVDSNEQMGKSATEQADKCADEQTDPASGKSGGLEELHVFLEEKRGKRAPFDVERELAHGGMGAVILARDRAIQRELAVKVMRPQIADSEEHRLRFLEEAQVTGQLEHPNIVPIHELGKDAEGNLYFTMKLVKGKSLGELLKELKSVGVRESGSLGEKKAEKPGAAETPAPPHAHTSPTPTPPHPHTPTLPDLLGIFLKICDGIAFAHSKGVIHRDLKPDNIMVGEFGEVQIMDWGLAKVVGDKGLGTGDEGEEEEGQRGANVQHPTSNAQRSTAEQKSETEIRKADTVPAGGPQSAIRNRESVRSVRSESDVALTVDGQITGTPAYMPPEQAEGRLELIDHRSDVYSLGAILYEILTLERPIEGDTVHKVLLNVSEGNVTPPEKRAPDRSVPKELSAITLKAMEKNRRKRYQSVPELSQDIKRYLAGRSVSAKEDTFLEAFTKLIKRNKAVSISVGVAAVVILAIAVTAFVRITRSRDEAIASRERALAAEKRQRDNALEVSKSLALQAEKALQKGRVEEAEIAADSSYRLVSDAQWGPYAKGLVAWEKRDVEAARRWLELAHKGDEPSVAINTALAKVLSLSGELEAAASLLKNLDAADDWQRLISVGDALLEVERYREAHKAFVRAVALLEDSSESKPQDLASAKEKLGRAEAWVKCEGFYESIADLAPAQQWERICGKLQELNGGKIGHAYHIVDGRLGSIDIIHSAVRYLQPLAGLRLDSLRLYDSNRLTDLSPLKGMALKSLNISSTGVTNLGPLRGMPVKSLDLHNTPVVDLSPLRGMPLTSLDLSGTQVNDLTALQGMPLTSLDLSGTQVNDLTALQGMPLRTLKLGGTVATDLTPLKGLPLETLDLSKSRACDLGPLRGVPLKWLNLRGTKVRDLSPLKGMDLDYLDLGGTNVTDVSPLEGMPLSSLGLAGTKVRDLEPLRGMPLNTLHLSWRSATDLGPLAGMPLNWLTLQCTRVTDLGPLKGAPLSRLSMERTDVTDLTPLEGMSLKEFSFTPAKISKGIEILRQMQTIQSISISVNHRGRPGEFWKKYDAGGFR